MEIMTLNQLIEQEVEEFGKQFLMEGSDCTWENPPDVMDIHEFLQASLTRTVKKALQEVREPDMDIDQYEERTTRLMREAVNQRNARLESKIKLISDTAGKEKE